MIMKTKNLSGVKVATGVKAGGLNPGNHNRRLVSLAVKTNIKAGATILLPNHSRRLA
jgi:hypothetical protein